MKRLLILLLFITACTSNLEETYEVTKVIDGDTIEIQTGETVRLSGINAPETGECYYQDSKDRLKKLILNKKVSLEKDKTNKGKYGRLLRYVHINSIEINSLLVREGYARVYDKYSYDTKKYSELKQNESIAKNKKLGIWNCKDPKQGCLYVGSKNSKYYHKPSCKWAKKIKQKNLICYTSESQVKNLRKHDC